jgi:hypothetical protein
MKCLVGSDPDGVDCSLCLQNMRAYYL